MTLFKGSEDSAPGMTASKLCFKVDKVLEAAEEKPVSCLQGGRKSSAKACYSFMVGFQLVTLNLMSSLEGSKYTYSQRNILHMPRPRRIEQMQGRGATPLLGHRLVTRYSISRNSPGCRTTNKVGKGVRPRIWKTGRGREGTSQWQAATKSAAEGGKGVEEDALIGAGGKRNISYITITIAYGKYN